MTRICIIDGCEEPYYARGWCKSHHNRWWRMGDPVAGQREPKVFRDSKVCAKCGIDKPICEFYANPKTGKWDSYCKGCKRDYDKAYKAANAEFIAARRRVYRAANAEHERAYRAANADAIKARTKAYYEANPDKDKARKERIRFNNKTSRAKNPDLWASRNLKNYYNITLDDYIRILEDQGGLCANPGCFEEPPVDRRFSVDHDHACCLGEKSCGKCIRGLLCHDCNLALGLLHEDVKRIRGLADYLESFK